jgi:hypothetical protein
MLSAIPLDLITAFLSFLFTVLILSYLVGDNPAFRLAIHAFIGVSAGYVAVVVFRQVVVDRLFLPLITGSWIERILLFFPLVFSFLLMGKMFANTEWLGRPVVALMVGVGTASAIAGAILGTIFPQTLALIDMFDLSASRTFGNTAGNFLTAVIALVGTVLTMAYFQFTISNKAGTPGKPGWFLRFITAPGRILIAITLGVIFAGVLVAALTALVDRIQSVVLFFDQIISGFFY